MSHTWLVLSSRRHAVRYLVFRISVPKGIIRPWTFRSMWCQYETVVPQGGDYQPLRQQWVCSRFEAKMPNHTTNILVKQNRRLCQRSQYVAQACDAWLLQEKQAHQTVERTFLKRNLRTLPRESKRKYSGQYAELVLMLMPGDHQSELRRTITFPHSLLQWFYVAEAHQHKINTRPRSCT